MARLLLRSIALLVIAGLVATLLAFTELGQQVVQGTGALLLVFLLPGTAIVAAVFPKGSLVAPERLLLVIVTSISVVILGGLVLNLTPWGLQIGSWLVLLVIVTLTAGAVAWFRRGRPSTLAMALPSTDIKFPQALLLAVSLVVTVAALKVASTPVPPQGLQGYTLLWMLPPESSSSQVVRLGIESKELTPMQYRLEIRAAGRTLYEWNVISLVTNEKWEANVELPPVSQPSGDVIEAILYRLDAPQTVYRHVMLSRPH